MRPRIYVYIFVFRLFVCFLRNWSGIQSIKLNSVETVFVTKYIFAVSWGTGIDDDDILAVVPGNDEYGRDCHKFRWELLGRFWKYLTRPRQIVFMVDSIVFSASPSTAQRLYMWSCFYRSHFFFLHCGVVYIKTTQRYFSQQLWFS